MTRPKSLVRIGSGDPSLHTINMCIYSHPGEGKTALWGTGNERVLILDSDPGMGTQTCGSLGNTPHVIPVTEYGDVQEVYEYVKHEMPKDLPEVKWVVWDSVTLFQDRALIDEIMPDAVAENPRQEEFVPSRREYLMNMNRIGRYIRLFVDLPTINFGMSAHVIVETDVSDGSTVWMPAVQGKGMASKVAGYMNVVGYLGKAQVGEGNDKKTINRLLTRRVGKFYAKDRFNALGKHVDMPTLPKIEQLIEAKKSSAPAPVRRRAVKKSASK